MKGIGGEYARVSRHDQGVDDMLVAFIVAILIFAFFVPIGRQDWSEFKPNLVAGFLALAGGVPVGLWVSRVAEDARRTRERAEAKRRRHIALEGLLGRLSNIERPMRQFLVTRGRKMY